MQRQTLFFSQQDYDDSTQEKDDGDGRHLQQHHKESGRNFFGRMREDERNTRQSHQEMKRFQWKSKTVIHPLVYIPSHFSLPSLLFLAMSFTLFHTFSNYIICFADKSTSRVLFLMMSLSFLTLTLFNQMQGNRINRKSIAKGRT